MKDEKNFNMDDFEKGLMLAGLISPASILEFNEREDVDAFENIKLQISPDNILDNLEVIGPWSFYHIARIAFTHYHPWLPDFNEDYPELEGWVMLKCEPDSKRLVEKYHKEIGFKESDLNPDFVNKY